MPQTAWRDGITPKYPAPVEPTVVRRLSASSSLPLLLKHRLPQTPLGPTGRDVRTAFESGGVHTEGARHLGSRLRRALAESQRERLQDRKRDRAKIDRLREKMKTQQIDEHRTRQISGYVHEPHLRDRAPLSPEQELALSFCFDKADKEFDTADGVGKVGLDERASTRFERPRPVARPVASIMRSLSHITASCSPTHRL